MGGAEINFDAFDPVALEANPNPSRMQHAFAQHIGYSNAKSIDSRWT
jgi:hypothetical protein